MIPVNDGDTITETPVGPFRRIKLSIYQKSGNGNAVFPKAKAVALVKFQCESSSTAKANSDGISEVTLTTDSIALQTTEPNSTPNNYDELGIAIPENFPSKIWKQLGNLESRSLVLQLCFRRLSYGVIPAGCTCLRGYAISQAFLSQPVV